MRRSRTDALRRGHESTASRSGVEREFRELVEQWRQDTEFLSSARQMASHPAYRKIIEMGRPAIPLILNELKRRPDHWFLALHAITGEDPVRPEDGFDQAVEAWLRWGREQGYPP